MANRDATLESIMTLPDTFSLVAPYLDIYDFKNIRLVSRSLALAVDLGDNRWYGRACDNKMQWPAGQGLRRECPNRGMVNRQTELVWCRGDLDDLDQSPLLPNGHGFGFTVCRPCRAQAVVRFQFDRQRQINTSRSLCDPCIGAMGPLRGPVALCSCPEDATNPDSNWCWYCRRQAHTLFDDDWNLVNGAIQRTILGPNNTIQWDPAGPPPGTPANNTGLGQKCACGNVVQQNIIVGYGVCVFCFKPRCTATPAGLVALQVQIPDVTIPGPRHAAKRPAALRAHRLAHPTVGARRSPRNHASSNTPGWLTPFVHTFRPPRPRSAATLANFHRRYQPMADFLVAQNDPAVRSRYWNWQW